MVGETGFEPATLCSQSRCATRLRHSPTCRALPAGPSRSKSVTSILIGFADRSAANRQLFALALDCSRNRSHALGGSWWWARQDSNLQPSRYERPALPLSYRPSPVGAGDRQGRAARQVAKSGLSAWKGEREGIRDDYEVPAHNSSEAANEDRKSTRLNSS